MQKRLYLFTFLLASAFHFRVMAQDTFSIVALDSVTREVGSAGASCVDLTTIGYAADFLGDLLPDKGAINTQASYLQANQTNARTRMNAGDSPSAIITWLTNNDAGGNPSQRQYGIVGFVGNKTEPAAYTGTNCQNVKYHKTGKTGKFCYAIQGNILLGQKVIDSMEARFIREPGDLKCKLMAALQGANMAGADTRCSTYGTSSLFAFLKVSKPTDSYGNPYYKIGVKGKAVSGAFEPIDSLQKVFNQTQNCSASTGNGAILSGGDFSLFPNPATDHITLHLGHAFGEKASVTVSNILGQEFYSSEVTGPQLILETGKWKKGVYVITIAGNGVKALKRVVVL